MLATPAEMAVQEHAAAYIPVPEASMIAENTFVELVMFPAAASYQDVNDLVYVDEEIHAVVHVVANQVDASIVELADQD